MSRLKVSHDEEADAVAVRFGGGTYSLTRPLDDDRNLDYDQDGRVIAVELLNVSDGVDLRGVPHAREIAAALRRRGIAVTAMGDIAQGSALARAVAAALVEHRARTGLSVRAIAERLSVSHPVYLRLERAEHTPSFETIEALAAKLGLRFVVDVGPASRSGEVTVPAGLRALEDVTSEGGSRILVAAG